MSSAGIGTIRAAFVADNKSFDVSIQATGEQLKAAGMAADMAAEKIVAAGGKIDRTAKLQEQAAERARRAWQLELLQQERAAVAQAASGRAAELAALKTDILSRSLEHQDGVLEKLRARFILTGETAHVSIRDFASAFSGLGELMAAGVVVAGTAHFVDETARMTNELGHLAVQAGIDITSLAGLQEIVKEMGVDWDPVATGIVRFQHALVQAQYGMTNYVRAFNDIGISMDQLKGKTPEEQLNLVADAMQRTDNTGRVADASITLFGRSGLALIPILKEYGSQLAVVMQRTGALTGVTDNADVAAKRWIADTQKLEMEWHAFLIPVMESLPEALGVAADGFRALGTIIESVFKAGMTSVVAFGESVAGEAKVFGDVFAGNFAAIPKDAREAHESMMRVLKAGESDIGADWKKLLESPTDHLALPRGINPGDVAPMKTGVQGDEQQLNAMKLDHQVDLDEEVKFWKEKLAVAKKGTADYDAIVAKLAPLLQRQRGPAAAAAQKSYASEMMLAFRRGLDEQKADHAMSVQEEADYWQALVYATQKGQKNYNALLAGDVTAEHNKAVANVTRQTASDQNAYVSSYIKDAFEQQAKQIEAARPESPDEAFSRMVAGDTKTAADQKKAALETFKAAEAQIQADERIQEAQIRILVEQGRLSRLQAAVALQALHNTSEGRWVSAYGAAQNSGAGMSSAEYEKNLGAYGTQSLQDAAAVQSATALGKLRDSAADVVARFTDLGTMLSDTIFQSLNNFNDTLIKVLSTPQSQLQGKHPFDQVGSAFFQSIGKDALQYLEGSVLKKVLGHDPNAKLGTKSNPMYTLDAATAGKGGPGAAAGGLLGWLNDSNWAGGLFGGKLFGPGGIFDQGGSSGPGGATGAGGVLGGLLSLVFGSSSTGAPTGTQASPFYTRSADGDIGGGGGLGGLLGSFGGLFSGFGGAAAGAGAGMGDVAGGIFSSLAGFASGGPIPSNMPAIVGENGPEIFMPSTSGRIIPNHMLGNGSPTIHIDARGANDPAAVEASVHRAMGQYLPYVQALAVAAQRDQARRTPSRSRR